MVVAKQKPTAINSRGENVNEKYMVEILNRLNLMLKLLDGLLHFRFDQ